MQGFLTALHRILPKEQILMDDLSRHAYAHDASQYLLIPQVIVKVESELDVLQVFALAREHQVALTFRAAGTSLSGQAQSDSVLLVLGDHWRDYTIIDDGFKIRLQPGLIGSEANLFLAPYHRKIGPDPASIGAAKIGGIAANNASGMCCGIAQNTYHTMTGIRIIFSDGSILDTENEDSCTVFKENHADFLQELARIRQQILADTELTALIQNQYKIKNTLGYSLNSYLDFEDPIEILAHLMIGSEGTLGFIASITYETVPAYPFEAATLLFFDSIEDACEAALRLPRDEIAAIELMDEAALKTGKIKGKAALLVDVKAETKVALQAKVDLLWGLIPQSRGDSSLINGAEKAPLGKGGRCEASGGFITDRREYNKIWAIRRGILPAVAGIRTPGSSLINEDVAVAPQDLPNFCRDLQALFKKHGYDRSCVFGHVKDGNLHFLLEADFASNKGVQTYDAFMQELVDLLVNRYQGALKAEHGTGRNMAPFVEKAWGEKCYAIMQRVKALFDAAGILSPDVVLSKNPQLHLDHLKQIPLVDPLIDRCIECGFCEKVCPSKKLTLTPRQRIVAMRDMKSLGKTFEDFQYRGIDTCAATGLCKTMCPVGINTGDIIRKKRFQAKTRLNHWLIRLWISHFALVMKLMKWLVLPMKVGIQRAGKVRRDPRPREDDSALKLIYYFPSCSARLFNNEQQIVLENILAKLGYKLTILKGFESQCCGLMFKSKGYLREGQERVRSLEKFLRAQSQGAPILCEMGSCVSEMRQYFLGEVPIYEGLEFLAEALEDISIKPLDKTIMLHITCSLDHLGLKDKMSKLAKRLATQVITPPDISCCGFAGEKGFSHPELNASALSTLKAQVPVNCHEGYSMSLTCEMGLSKASGISYRSLLYLIDEALH